MAERQALLYEGPSRREALAMREFLATQGIEAIVADWAGSIGRWPVSTEGKVVVIVADNDMTLARRLTARWQQERLQDELEDDEATPAQVLAVWPECGQCGERLATRCPICRTVDDDFPAADLPNGFESASRGSSADAADIVLLCTMCDEPFEPRWLRYCRNCGHDQGQGVVVAEETVQREAINGRVVSALLILVGMGVLAFVYFAWLL